MKASKHLFAVILLILIIMLYKVLLTYESVDDEILWCDHSNETLRNIMLYKVLLTYESVDEVLWCDHSNETC